MAARTKSLLGMAASAVIGAGMWTAFWWLEGSSDPLSHSAYWQVGYPLMVAAALFLGGLFPDGAWRYGVCMVLTQIAIVIWQQGPGAQFGIGLVVQAVIMLPLILASYIGVFFRRRWSHEHRASS
jgi:hypothetical protein